MNTIQFLQSTESLQSIVEYYRKPLGPQPIVSVADAKERANAILINYLISDAKLGIDELASLLKDPARLSDELQRYPTEKQDVSDLPPLPEGSSYSLSLIHLGEFIRNNCGKFTNSSEDHKRLIIGDKLPREFTYPSGKEVPYFVLGNEQSANTDVFLMGQSHLPLKEIIIRDNFLIMMNALARVSREDPDFSSYHKYFDEFETVLPGIAIAHELGELQLAERPMKIEKEMDHELMAEHLGLQFLQRNNVPQKFYELFHLLRASKDERYDVSRRIVDSTFNL